MASAMLRVVLCLALAAAVSCQTAPPLTLAKLPKNVTVKITGYEQGGAMMPPNPPCMTQTLGSCPTVLQAAEDSLMASYTIQPAIIATLKNFTAVSMYACYSANSYYDRAWRAPNKANLAKSKDCPYLIKKGIKGTSGNVTWNVPEGVPDSTLYVRAYAMCEKADGTLVRCAYGNSPGFIEVKKINDTPAAMKAACAVCCCITPILVTLILFYERRFKKHAV